MQRRRQIIGQKEWTARFLFVFLRSAPIDLPRSEAQRDHHLLIIDLMLYAIYFIYGLCVMFYFMMAWLFYRKDKELLSKLVTVLMLVIGMQCLKDLLFIKPIAELDETDWMIITSSDVIAIPLYAFTLIELCSPASLTRRTIIIHELLFIVPFVLFFITRDIIYYYAEILEALVYGLCYTIWAAFAIPKYHRELKRRFSYTENINLNWLRAIFLSFVLMLALWIADSLHAGYSFEILYMSSSLVVWMFIAYNMYKHESVLDELYDGMDTDIAPAADATETEMSEIGRRISLLFDKDQIFLNPNLKVSDIATAIGTNRTYVSEFFNKEEECSFYDYVNRARIEYACTLLDGSDANIMKIAELSGFNSSQSFIRVFSKLKGISPTRYRKDGCD